MGEQLKVASHLALGAAHPLGDGAKFTQVRGIEGEDLVRLTQVYSFEDNSLRLINLWRGHSFRPVAMLVL
ncbi:hypothetical protein ES703_87172 [subsurface metagenome]